MNHLISSRQQAIRLPNGELLFFVVKNPKSKSRHALLGKNTQTRKFDFDIFLKVFLMADYLVSLVEQSQGQATALGDSSW